MYNKNLKIFFVFVFVMFFSSVQAFATAESIYEGLNAEESREVIDDHLILEKNIGGLVAIKVTNLNSKVTKYALKVSGQGFQSEILFKAIKQAPSTTIFGKLTVNGKTIIPEKQTRFLKRGLSCFEYSKGNSSSYACELSL
jgi:hypothetical protein